MANIDVTELLADPDFVDQIWLVTRTPRVNYLGQQTLLETKIPSVGSVQPASGRTISRLPESLRVANVMSFWFKGKIEPSGDSGKYPSLIVFRGQRFQIQMIFDWSGWGEGYSEGVCVAEALS